MDKQAANTGNAFTYNGKTHYLIRPQSREDLASAITIMHELQQLIAYTSNSPDARIYSDLNSEQTAMIYAFIESLGKYDPAIIQKNLVYLAKKYGISIGELETFLGVSPGYISRTSKEGSGKRLGLEIAWRAALIFDVDLTELVTHDLTARRGNTTLILKFIDKLIDMTRDGKIQWQNWGGYNSDLDDQSLLIGSIIAVEEEEVFYLSREYDSENGTKMPLAEDIVALPHFINGKTDLILMPYRENIAGDIRYDFLTITNNRKQEAEDGSAYTWSRFFSFYDDYDHIVDKAADKLYDAIRDMGYDAIITPENKAFIENFLDQ